MKWLKWLGIVIFILIPILNGCSSRPAPVAKNTGLPATVSAPVPLPPVSQGKTPVPVTENLPQGAEVYQPDKPPVSDTVRKLEEMAEKAIEADAAKLKKEVEATPTKPVLVIPPPEESERKATTPSKKAVTAQLKKESAAKKEPVKAEEKVVLLEKEPAPSTTTGSEDKKDTTENMPPVPAEKEPDIVIDFESMPIEIPPWVLDYEIIPNTNRINCILRSQPLTMDDGEGGTPVYLHFRQRTLKAVTKSSIDLEYADDGLQIDLNPLHPIDSVQKETIAVFEQDWDTLINELKSGRQAVLTLGFWPTWPMSRTYSVTFNLTHFARAWRALQTCQKQASTTPILYAVKN